MELRNVKKDYVHYYNKLKLDRQILSSIGKHQIFIMTFEHYKKLSKFTEEETYLIKNFDDIMLNQQDYFPEDNLSVCLTMANNEVLVAHYFKDLSVRGGYFATPATDDKITSKIKEEQKKFCDYVLQALLFSLNMKETVMGTEPITMRKKSGQSEITPITYVSSKKYSTTQKNTKGEPIEWKHSWEVIGHWRVCNSIGKDRNGEYNQVNRTWIVPSVRGKGELIKKLRIIR